MAGQHWEERGGQPSRLENALIGVVSTGLTLGYIGLLLLLGISFLRAESCMVTRVSDGDTVGASLNDWLPAALVASQRGSFFLRRRFTAFSSATSLMSCRF